MGNLTLLHLPLRDKWQRKKNKMERERQKLNRHRNHEKAESEEGRSLKGLTSMHSDRYNETDIEFIKKGEQKSKARKEFKFRGRSSFIWLCRI